MYVGYVPDQPDQTFGSDVLLGLELVENEGLESGRLGGGSLLPLSHFLWWEDWLDLEIVEGGVAG